MDVERFETPEAFDLPQWRDVLAADPTRHVFSTPEWHRVWWEEFGAGKKLFVLTFLDPHPVGLAALTLDDTEAGGGLRFLGGDDLTDYMGPLSAGPAHLPAIADALVRYVLEEIDGWSVFDARCLPVPFGFAEWLAEAADRHRVRFEIDQHEMTAVLALPDSFDTYLEGLDAKDRHEVRRKLRRLDRELSGADVSTADASSLEADLKSFIDLHRGSEGLKGKFMAPERQTFFARIARAFQPLGWLSLNFLEANGRRAASTFGYDFEGTYSLYNSAYEREFRPLSPGLVLVVRLIERCIARGIRRFDFLRGEERYKFQLGAQALPLHAVRLFHHSTPQVRPAGRGPSGSWVIDPIG